MFSGYVTGIRALRPQSRKIKRSTSEIHLCTLKHLAKAFFLSLVGSLPCSLVEASDAVCLLWTQTESSHWSLLLCQKPLEVWILNPNRFRVQLIDATSASLVCIFLTLSFFPCTKDFKNLTAQPRITRWYYSFHWMIPKKVLFSFSSSFTFFVFVFIVLFRHLPHLCLLIRIKSMVLVYVSFCLTCLFLSPNPVLAGSRISESGPADFPKEEGA